MKRLLRANLTAKIDVLDIIETYMKQISLEWFLAIILITSHSPTHKCCSIALQMHFDKSASILDFLSAVVFIFFQGFMQRVQCTSNCGLALCRLRASPGHLPWRSCHGWKYQLSLGLPALQHCGTVFNSDGVWLLEIYDLSGTACCCFSLTEASGAWVFSVVGVFGDIWSSYE